MDVYDFSTGVDCKDIYFVISDENIFGTLTVQEVEGNFYSSFDKTTYSKLQSEYAIGDSICLGFYENQFLIYTENGYYHADSGDVVTGLDYFNSVNANVTPIEIDSQIDLASIPMQKSVLYNNVLDVPLAANALMNGKGLCWAACIASKYNYYHGTSMPCQAVYSKLQHTYGGTADGSIIWVLKGYHAYNMASMMTDGVMSCSEVTSHIQKNNPIHVDLSGQTSSGTNVYHAVLLCGVKVYQGYALYYIGDSNRTEYLTSVYVSSEMMQGKTSFVYAVPNDWQGTEFSEWRWSACEG